MRCIYVLSWVEIMEYPLHPELRPEEWRRTLMFDGPLPLLGAL